MKIRCAYLVPKGVGQLFDGCSMPGANCRTCCLACCLRAGGQRQYSGRKYLMPPCARACRGPFAARTTLLEMTG